MSNKILHIDTDLQIPNRIHKNDSNEVSQITDKAQNIAFTQSNLTKQPTYNYDGYFNFDGIDDFLQAPNPDVFSGYQWRMVIKLRMDSNDTSVIFTTRTTPFGVGSVGIVCYNNYLIVQISINGSQYSIPIKLRVDLFVGEDIFCILEKKGNVIKAYFPEIKDYMYTGENVYVESYTLVSDIIEYDPTAKMGIFGGDVYLPDYTLQGRLYFMYVTDTPILFDLPYSIGDTVPNKLSDKPFNYYHRYKDDGNIKLYLSSKFLKGAVINESNEITSISNLINSEKESFIATRLGQEPLLTKNGLLFGVTKTERLFAYNTDSEQEGVLGTFNENSKSFISCWMNNVTRSPNQYFLTFRTNFTSYYVRFVNSNGLLSAFCGGTSSPITKSGLITNKYYHIAVSYDLVNFYLYVDGILVGSKPHSFTDREALLGLNIGAFDNGAYGHFMGYLDDIFLSIGESIINPTGFAVGQKVFEPPRRGGFNSDIKQY